VTAAAEQKPLSDRFREIVNTWEYLSSDTPLDLCVKIRIPNAPEFPGGRLPIEGAAGEEPVVDWWPVRQIDQRRSYLQKHGPFISWEPTKKGQLATAEALYRARGAERIAVWVQGAMWDAGKDHWSVKVERHVRPIWNDIYVAVREVTDELGVSRHHNSTALPLESMGCRMGEWLRADFESPEHDEHQLLQRIVGYAVLRRALVLSQWALVDVAAASTPRAVAPADGIG
jgi:hypothetical protein